MPVLDLPKTKLTLHRDALVKHGPGDCVVARHPTEEIVSIGLEKTREYGIALVLTAVLLALAFVSYTHVASPAWSWTGVIVCLGGCAVVIASIEGRRVVIETTAGTASYPVADMFEQAEGFVLSANSILGRRRSGGGSETAGGDDEPLASDRGLTTS